MPRRCSSSESSRRPRPRPGELRVRLVASATNPADCNRRRGNGYAMEFPLVIPNSDGAGVVDAVGDGVDAAWLGQRVWLYNGQRGRALGTAAEYIALDENLVMPLPEGTGFCRRRLPRHTVHDRVSLRVRGRTGRGKDAARDRRRRRGRPLRDSTRQMGRGARARNGEQRGEGAARGCAQART